MTDVKFGTSAVPEGSISGYPRPEAKGVPVSVEDVTGVDFQQVELTFDEYYKFDAIVKRRGLKAAQTWAATKELAARADAIIKGQNEEMAKKQMSTSEPIPAGRLYIQLTERDTGKQHFFWADPPVKKTFWQKVKSFFS